ncbi:hypothetical protein BDZ91DRAFT_555157 [Kalaharituber pfeilii]|nr:hypothetical protein BDZ91DRAFT_555157 [Kalaharituber pfeilii]
MQCSSCIILFVLRSKIRLIGTDLLYCALLFSCVTKPSYPTCEARNSGVDFILRSQPSLVTRR